MASRVSVEGVELGLDLRTYAYVSTLHYEHLEGVFFDGHFGHDGWFNDLGILWLEE